MRLLSLIGTFLLLVGCHKSYKVENNQVIYYYYTDAEKAKQRVLSKADSKSFKELKSGYAIDKSHAYYRG